MQLACRWLEGVSWNSWTYELLCIQKPEESAVSGHGRGPSAGSQIQDFAARRDRIFHLLWDLFHHCSASLVGYLILCFFSFFLPFSSFPYLVKILSVLQKYLNCLFFSAVLPSWWKWANTEPGRSLLPGPVSSHERACWWGVPGSETSPLPGEWYIQPHLLPPQPLHLLQSFASYPELFALVDPYAKSQQGCLPPTLLTGTRTPLPGLHLSVKYVTSWITSLPGI